MWLSAVQLHELRLFILLSKYLTLLEDQHFSAALVDSDMLDQLNDETQSGHMSMIYPNPRPDVPFSRQIWISNANSNCWFVP